jgi:hypothetical protein
MRSVAAWAVWVGRSVAFALLTIGAGAVFLPDVVRLGVVKAGGATLVLVQLIETVLHPPSVVVVEKFAADTARATGGVVINLGAAIHTTSALAGNIVQLRGAGAGAGGGSAILGFHSDVMERLMTGDYPTVEAHRLS